MMYKGFFCGLLLAALLFSAYGDKATAPTTPDPHQDHKDHKVGDAHPETKATSDTKDTATSNATKVEDGHTAHDGHDHGGHDDPNVKTTVAGKCLKAKKHKAQPSEEKINGICEPWAESSCCNTSVANEINTAQGAYKFIWNHCPREQEALSHECFQWFRKDLCFYECSPHNGLWIQPDANRNMRDERIQGVPLCQSECDAWFNACADDYTCSDNWYKGFNFTTGKGECISNATCRTINETFGNAKNFCEKVWDNSFKVVSDKEKCIQINVTDAKGAKKNGDVSNYYYSIKQDKATAGQIRLAAGMSIVLSVALSILWVVQ